MVNWRRIVIRIFDRLGQINLFKSWITELKDGRRQEEKEKQEKEE